MSNLLLLATTLVFAYTVEAVNIIPRSYIIEYAPGTDHHNVIQGDLFQFQELYEIHHTYSSPIFHGMSFTLKDPPAIPKTQHKHLTPVSYSVNDKTHPVFNHISTHPAIKNIYPVYEVPRPQWIQNPKNISYTFPYANKDSQINDIHKELGITGKGILIGVLDSGIDYHHPALGGGFGEGFKVRYGKNLVAASNDEENGLKSLGEDDPFDPCLGYDAGHGTHVSGIIAGYDKEMNFTGVAPDATLGFWRIFGCQGGAAADTVIKAMEMAYEAGCQIINLSLGIESSWPEDAMAAVAENLSKKGVIVVGVAGNQGPNGAYSQNSPASARSVISTASVDNWFYPAKVMDINIFPDSYFPFMFSSNTISFPNGILASIVSEGTFPFGCANDTAITTEKVQGKIMIVKRGLCSFNEKLIEARTAGAIGVLFYDPEAENNALIVAKTEKDLLPCAGIEKELALRLIDYYKEPVSASPIEITFPDTNKIVVPDTAGRISDFSSTGPTYELDLKPSITGIGGDIYSTLPRHIDQGFGVRSGTSMAAPHIAGCAALFLDYFSKQNLAPSFIMEHMQNHAKPVIAKSGIPEHPIVQGAGLIQPYDTMKSKVHVSPSHISFNDTASLTEYKSYTLNIINSNSVPLSVSIENIQSNSIETFANMTSFTPTEPALTNGKLKVELEFSPVSQGRTLILSPMSTASVRVKVILPDPNEIFYHYQMYGGFISIKNTETSESLATVPYFGVLGKMVDLPLFDTGYPYLAPASNLLNRQGENVTYQYDMTHKVKTKPSIVLRLLTGSAKIEINVYDENQNNLGLLSGGPWTYNQRNTLAEDNYDDPIAWNGKFIPIGKEKEIGDNSVQAKDGTYYLFLRALKHFGDPDNKKDWKEWKSGPIQVKN